MNSISQNRVALAPRFLARFLFSLTFYFFAKTVKVMTVASACEDSLENENLLSFSSTAESFPAYYMKNASEVGEKSKSRLN